jgi:hypothetical protein
LARIGKSRAQAVLLQEYSPDQTQHSQADSTKVVYLMTFTHPIAFGLIAVPWFAGVFLVAGCSQAPQPGNSVVRGHVTYKGQKLITGMVEFWNQDGPVGVFIHGSRLPSSSWIASPAA